MTTRPNHTLWGAVSLFWLLWTLTVGATGLRADTSEDLFKNAVSLDKNGFFEDSAVAWKKVLESQPEKELRDTAQLKLSSTYFKLGQFSRAIDTARDLTEKDPSNFDAWFHLANALSGIQRFPEAAEAYRKTTELRPDEGLGYVGLALTLFGDGHSKEAIEQLMKVRALFKSQKNISWHRNASIMIQQINHFANYPRNFADLWLQNNLKLVRTTYDNAVFIPADL